MFFFDLSNLHASWSDVLTKEPHQISSAELTGDWGLCMYRARAEQLTWHQGWWRSVRWSGKLPGDDKSGAVSHQNIFGMCLCVCIYVPGETGFTVHTSMSVYTHIHVYIHHIHIWAVGLVLAPLCHILRDPVMILDSSLGLIVCFGRRGCSFFKTLFLDTAPWALHIQMVHSYDQLY